MFSSVALVAVLIAGPLQIAGEAAQTPAAAPTVAAVQAPTPATPATGTPATPAAPERMICRNESITGTRFPIRRCRTASQTEADRIESREMLRRMQGARTPQPG